MEGMVSRANEVLREPRYAGLPTYMRLAHTRDPADIDIAVAGIPFDSAGNTGTRFGPRAIRQASSTLRGVDGPSGIDPRAHRKIRDYGDLSVMPGAVESSHRIITEQLTPLLTQRIQTLCLGGDHSVTLPELRACAQTHPGLALVHFDSHSDTYDAYYGGLEYATRHNSGTLFRRAIDERLIDPGCSIQIGMRGTLYTAADWDEARDLGLEVLTTDEWLSLSPEAFRDRLIARTAGRPVFLSFDVDVFDPSCVPGVGTPEPGGPTSREVFRYLRALRGLPIVAGDVVEVCPPQDIAGITSTLAAHVVFQLLILMAGQGEG
jgi:agmatinase